jgi:3-keto-5-aminohexanoate cleavage enzyme
MENYLVGDYRNTLDYVERISRGGLENFPPAIISCAITGSFQGKEVNPNLPELVEEQVQQTYDAYQAGAVMVHVHARQPEKPGEMSEDTGQYKEINRRIREKCPDIIINNTDMGGRMLTPEGKIGNLMLASIPARPEIASIDLAHAYDKVLHKKRPAPLTGRDEDELRQHFYVIQPEDAIESIQTFIKYDVKPEFEIFDLSGIKMLRQIIKMSKGEVKSPYWLSVIFGGIGIMPSITAMIEISQLLPKEAMVNIIGVGAAQMPMITTGLILGHNIRVGLEDNVFYSQGRLAKSNAEMVERAVRIAKELGRPLATPAQARKMLGLGGPRQYS